MRQLRYGFMALLNMLFGSEAIWACSVCLGQAESPVLAGLNLSILFMLGITYLLVASFAGFFVYLRRREKLFRTGPPDRN